MGPIPVLMVCLLFLIPNLAFSLPRAARGQQAVASISGVSLLQKSVSALASNVSIADVTLAGSARLIAGSDDETGTVNIKALSIGSARIDLNLGSGRHSEIRAVTSSGPSGSWSGSDGVVHSMAYHNVVNDSGLFPLFSLTSIASNQNSVVTVVGPDARNGKSVIHLTTSRQFPNLDGDSASLMQQLSQVDVYLDAATNLPASIIFKIHPDDNALLDIPVEIRFSDYRNVGGAQIPFRVEKFVNNSLSLDLQFQKAAVNSGISANEFSVQ